MEVKDEEYLLSVMDGKEQTTYEAPTLKPFGLRGNWGLFVKSAPSQLVVQFLSAHYEYVRVLSFLGSSDNGIAQFFVFNSADKIEETPISNKIKNSSTENTTKEYREQNNEKEDKVLEVATNAEFVGGIEAMWQFIYDHLRYPEDARRNEIEGSIKVHFTVSKEGEIQNIRVDNKDTIGFNLENEAVRVISIMPKWKPAKGEQTHKAYSSDFNLSIRFRLNDNKTKSFTIEELKSEFNRLNKKLESLTGEVQLQGVLGEYQGKAIRLKNQINVQLKNSLIDKQLIEKLEYRYQVVVNSINVEIYKLKVENEKLSNANQNLRNDTLF